MRILLYIILLPVILQAQLNNNLVKGFAYNKTTGKPIENVNVFISNSYFGSVTDSDGFFYINNIPKGSHELVISSVGYEIIVRSINVPNNKELKIFLKPKVYKLDSVDILAEKPTEWLNHYQKFRNQFIGEEGFFQECEILNKEIIQFDWNNNILTASAYEPLRVINKALGFNIECYLLNFSWSENEGITKYSVKTRFRDIDSSLSEEIFENRKAAYSGSLEHFLNCLIDEKVLECGYKIFQKASSFEMKLFSKDDKMISSDQLIEKIPNKDLYLFKLEGYLKIINDRNISWLRINREQVLLNKNGYPVDSYPFEVQGYWAKMGISQMLPKYYEFIE